MSYTYTISDEIEIDPPIPARELPEASRRAWQAHDPMAPAVAVRLNEDGNAEAIIGRTDDKLSVIATEIRQIVDAAPGRTYPGSLELTGEDPDDQRTLTIEDGRVVVTE